MMQTSLEYYSQNHPINKFIAVMNNEVKTVQAIKMRDWNTKESSLIEDPTFISAYCYAQLEVFYDFSIEEFYCRMSDMNENWEIEEVIFE